MLNQFIVNKTANGYMVRVDDRDSYHKRPDVVGQIDLDCYTFESLSALLRWIESNFTDKKCEKKP